MKMSPQRGGCDGPVTIINLSCVQVQEAGPEMAPGQEP